MTLRLARRGIVGLPKGPVRKLMVDIGKLSELADARAELLRLAALGGRLREVYEMEWNRALARYRAAVADSEAPDMGGEGSDEVGEDQAGG